MVSVSRPFSPADYNAIKTAFKLLLLRLGGVEAAASCTSVKKSLLADYGSVASERFARCDVIMDLERVAGEPIVTAALARAQGCALVMTEPVRARSEMAVLLARIGQDAGELFATAALALGHKKPTAKERATMLRELDDLRRAADEAIAHLQQDDGA